MANYWDEEEKKRQKEQLQVQQKQQTQQQNQQNTQMQQAAQNAPSMNQQTPYMGTYQQGAAVQQAQQMLQQQINNKPGNYQSPYMQQVSQLYEQVINRPQFKYNINADPLYQQYKNQYVQQGQKAMQDTVGNMAGLTGGYGNSYALGAGQQEYQRYLGQLNNVMPELYGQAYEQYTQEGDELRQNLATAQGMENQEYSRYRDSLGDWQAERDYLAGRYDTEANREYSQYMDALGYRSDAYSLAIDMMGRGMMPDAQTLQMAGLTEEQASAYLKSLQRGSGSGSGRKTVFVTPEVQQDLQGRIEAGTTAGTKPSADNALNVAKQGLYEGLPDAVIERQMMQTMADQRGTGQGLLNALAYGSAMEAAGITGPQTTANLLATKKTQMGLPVTQATTNMGSTYISQDVAQKYGDKDKDYQSMLTDILKETDDEKKKKK